MFPTKLYILGHIKEGRYLKADPHKLLAIANAPLPKSVGQLRSFLGTYKTFRQYQKKMAMNLGPMEDMHANKQTADKLEWKPETLTCLKEAKQKIKALHNTFIPKKTDQLVITMDWSKKGIAATLFMSN